MRTRKRLYIVYWNMGLGGIQKRIRDVVDDMSKKNLDWDIYVLMRKRSNEGFDSKIAGLDRVTVRYYDVNSRFHFPLGFVFWIGFQYLKIRPNVVLTFQCLLASVLVIYKYICFWIPVKLVINEGAVTSQAIRWQKLSFMGILIRYMYPLSNIIIVPTLACKTDLISKYHVPEKKIFIIPNWTNFPQECSLSPVYDILYVGRFDAEKNPLFMVELVKTLIKSYKNLKIGMVGNGDLYSDLMNEVRSEKLQNTFKILPFSPDISAYLQHARVLMVPSFNEGMPNVVLEAAMCGVPAVINNFLGAESVVVHRKTGYIYSSKNEAKEYIDIMLKNTHHRDSLGKNARKYVSDNFSYATQLRFIETVLS